MAGRKRGDSSKKSEKDPKKPTGKEDTDKKTGFERGSIRRSGKLQSNCLSSIHPFRCHHKSPPTVSSQRFCWWKFAT